jgi:hypothetical protein
VLPWRTFCSFTDRVCIPRFACRRVKTGLGPTRAVGKKAKPTPPIGLQLSNALTVIFDAERTVNDGPAKERICVRGEQR